MYDCPARAWRRSASSCVGRKENSETREPRGGKPAAAMALGLARTWEGRSWSLPAQSCMLCNRRQKSIPDRSFSHYILEIRAALTARYSIVESQTLANYKIRICGP